MVAAAVAVAAAVHSSCSALLDFSVVLLLPFLSSTLLASLVVLGRRLARHLQLACYAALQRSAHLC